MKEWRVATRLTVLAGVLSALVVAIGGLGLWGMQRAEDGIESIYEDHMEPALVLGEIGDRLMSTRLSLAIAVHTHDAATLKSHVEAIESNIADIDATWKAYLQRLQSPEEGKQLARAVLDGWSMLWVIWCPPNYCGHQSGQNTKRTHQAAEFPARVQAAPGRAII